ncbi:MAG TPA: SDR family NAD(P)-dependent oxidoreductase [Vicinamibacterales bacterium]|nr:SDR family NAD(P)-dependent oxidoreductase [Vicinamibacterales bacterium]
MNQAFGRTAVIIGASSGIGEALTRELNRGGWRLGLLARRLDRLEALRQSLAPGTLVRHLDVTQDAAATILQQVLNDLGDVDLVIISAGTGHNNQGLRRDLDAETVTVNVLGFMTMAQVALRHFLAQGHGHLVGISSVAALRGNAAAAAYAASKAFQSVYLDGLRELARKSGHPIVVTEVQPGGVDRPCCSRIARCPHSRDDCSSRRLQERPRRFFVPFSARRSTPTSRSGMRSSR